MGTVLSGMSLLLALAIAGGLIALSRRAERARRRRGRHGSSDAAARQAPGYTTMGYAFSSTLLGALLLVSGLIGYRVGRSHRSGRWSDDYLWGQIWIGLAVACAAAWFWRKGVREIRSNVYTPELAGREVSAPPSRRIERR
jgi:hypothetical protein